MDEENRNEGYGSSGYTREEAENSETPRETRGGNERLRILENNDALKEVIFRN